MLSIDLEEFRDPTELEARWRALEEQSTCSFFQSWTWTGCLLRKRFPRPVLLEARQDGVTAALALFNRRGGWARPDRLWLGASGIADLDTVFVEHNGVLLARGREDLLTACLRAALKRPFAPGRRRRARTLILSGVGEDHVRAAQALGRLQVRETHSSPFVDLAAIRAARRDYLNTLSSNARYQIRRSMRRYGAAGPLCIRRAETIEEAYAFFGSLAELHQATWTRRGKPGAFANRNFVTFHRELIGRAFPRREIDLLRVSAGSSVVGYLYNFRFHGMVLTYQSGFAYALADSHRKPGLTCHALAIELYLGEGEQIYDFLAGDDRYKLTMANASAKQYWVSITPNWSIWGINACRHSA